MLGNGSDPKSDTGYQTFVILSSIGSICEAKVLTVLYKNLYVYFQVLRIWNLSIAVEHNENLRLNKYSAG